MSSSSLGCDFVTSLISRDEDVIRITVSFSLVYISLVGSVTIANGQTEWSWSTNFNRIRDSAWLKSSCV